jgi:hypothetical protein
MTYFQQDIPLPESFEQHVIGWARGKFKMRLRNPGLPAEWHPVLAIDPAEPNRKLHEGSLWLWHMGRVREVYAGQYEVVAGAEQP